MSQETPIPPADEDALLLVHVQQRDVPCPLCEYNLRALTSTRCPECGHRLRLRVGLVDPYMRLWIATLIPICGSAGIGVVFAIAVMMFGPPDGRNAGFASLSLTWFIGCIPLAAVLLIGRRGFMTWSRTAQRRIATVAWLGAAVGLTTFFVSGW